MTLTVLTCSTGRPEALELCRLYMSRQTHKHNHLVVEGGTLIENMRRGLDLVDSDLVICEDDDWYSPTWVATQADLLERAEIAGQRETMNYHVPSGGWISKPNKLRFASLHCTSLRRSALPKLRAALDHPEVEIGGRIRIDIVLWLLLATEEKYELSDGFQCVSLKGMPGRHGLSAKHSRFYYTTFDRDRSLLRSLIGDDIQHYSRFFR